MLQQQALRPRIAEGADPLRSIGGRSRHPSRSPRRHVPLGVAGGTDVVDITLQSSDKGPAVSELEYKVRMKAGDSLIYSWTVDGLDDPEEFYFDFHGETPAGPENPKPTVVEYHQSTGGQSHGTLVAPIAGVHGWYLQNQSAATVVVRLKLSGFYELVPPGQYGNLNGIVARPILP